MTTPIIDIINSGTGVPSSARPGWRDVLPIHPAAELLPPMSAGELHDLAEDIKRHGQRIPVSIQEGKLLDGRNRLDAMERAGMPVVRSGALNLLVVHVETIDSSVDPYAFVLSANIRRRHLTPEQKPVLIVALLKAQPEKSNRQIAKLVGASHPYVAKVRHKSEQSGDVETVTTTTDTKGRKQPVKPRGMTQKRKLGIFDRTISLIYDSCERTEDTLDGFCPRLSAQQKADAKRQLTDAIGMLRRCLVRVAKAPAP